MQETQMPRTDGGASRIIASGIDRRLRTQNGMNQQQQALKCPRCDSLNTKFCYYNNYNLSQPRHFCKACRRYWTKGGVLRKVPVGGGCRRAKRTAKALTPVVADDVHKDKENSSSDSSTLEAEAVSGNTSFSSGPQFSDLGLFIDHACEGAGSMFPEIGGLVTSSEDVMTSSREVGSDDRDLLMFGSQGGDYLDQTGRIDSEIFDLAGTVDQTYLDSLSVA